MFMFGDGHLRGTEEAQRRQLKPALLMMEQLRV
jgi:hypothetical protein